EERREALCIPFLLIAMRVYAENPKLTLILIDKFGISDDMIRTEESEWMHADNSLILIENPLNPLLSNLLRMSISHVDKNIRIAILKEEWKNGEEDKIDRFIRGEYSRIHKESEEARKRMMSLGDGSWRDERLIELNSNRTIPMIEYSIFTVSLCTRDDINRYLNDVPITQFDDQKTRKPPNLHWTPSVLEGDLEITLRLRFFISLPDREIISILAKDSSSYFSNVYEWTDGLLLSNDSGKIHVQRINDNTLSIAGRICYEEEEDVSAACYLLWSIISFAAKRILLSLPNNQFNSDLVLIGKPLFHGSIDNRVFDLTTFMNTACRCGKIGFNYRGKVEMMVSLPLY
uniref:Uncharacterized protein n=1 Tax=Pristionchus pacificus TaxID=54126 RepID=A0A8R1V519_PRIPA